MNRDDREAISRESLPLYFKNLVDDGIKRQQLSISDDSASYVVNLLHDFTRSEILLRSQSQALATLFLEAKQQAVEPSRRMQLYKQVGDVALYVSGFFSDSLKRKLVDVDYYINMGGNAYANLSSLVRNSNFGDLYSELSTKFYALVGLLSFISEERQLTSNEDILRLYERWLRTGSKHLYEKLINYGVLPVAAATAGTDDDRQ